MLFCTAALSRFLCEDPNYQTNLFVKNLPIFAARRPVQRPICSFLLAASDFQILSFVEGAAIILDASASIK